MSQQYISKELIHFTQRYETLRNILTDCVLLGGPNIEESRKLGTCFSFHYRENVSHNAMIEVNKVCFSDIPEGQTGTHKKKYGNFGLVFDKDFIVRKGGVPVHYIPINAAINSRWTKDKETRASFFNRMTKELYSFFDSLIVESNKNADEKKRIKYQRLHDFCMTLIIPYFKFFDHTLPDDNIYNYYFEREWRVLGSVKFKLDDVKKVLLPKEYKEIFRRDFPNYKGIID